MSLTKSKLIICWRCVLKNWWFFNNNSHSDILILAVNFCFIPDEIKITVKAQNRRIYVGPKHLVNGEDLDKKSGAELGSLWLAVERGSGQFRLDRSAYVADKIIDHSTEGQEIWGASEKDMVLYNSEQARLGINVINNEREPFRLQIRDGVKILHVGTGHKALEAIDYLYRNLHEPLRPAA